MFENHIEQIETPNFQTQFVAISGISVLELVLSTHPNIRSLLADMATGQVAIQEVFGRALYLLQKVSKERDSSYDGSVSVYLYCLSKFDARLVLKARDRIGKIKGLFWSRQLAREISDRFHAQQLSQSLSMSSLYEHRPVFHGDNDSSTVVYGSTSRTSPYTVPAQNQNLQWDVELVTPERVIA